MLLGRKNALYSLVPAVNMKIPSGFIISLILTAVFSFAIPVTIVGLVFGLAVVVSLIPGFAVFGHEAANGLLEFLAVFGTGKPIAGVFTLGLTSSFVGVLFDLFNIYRYQSLRE